MTIIIGLLVAFLLVSTAAKAELKADQLLGTWYSSKQTEDGEIMQWLVKRIDKQNYASIFMICSGENLSWVQKEIGIWALENDSLVHTPHSIEDFTGKKSVKSGTSMTYTDVSLNANTLSYKKQGQTVMTFNSVSGSHQISCKN